MSFLDYLPLPWGTRRGVLSPWADDSHLADIVFADIFPGLDPSALPLKITRDVALRVGAVARGRNIIANTIGTMPLKMHRGGEVVPSTGWVAQPDPGRPTPVMLAYTVDSLFFFGHAWWAIEGRDGAGWPTRFRFVPSDRLKWDQERGTVTIDGDKPVTRKDTEFIRFDGMSDGLLKTAADALTRAVAIELHQVAGDPLTKAQIDELTSRWSAARRGKNGGVAYTNASIEARMHGAAPEQLLIAGRHAASLELARHMGLPAWAVDAPVDGSSLTYTSVPSQSRALIDFCLRGYMAPITARLSMDDVLPPGEWVHLDASHLTRGDFGERMAAGKTAVEAGIYTPEEVRQLEAETPVEDRR